MIDSPQEVSKTTQICSISKCDFLVEALWYMCSGFCQGSRLDLVWFGEGETLFLLL